MSRNKKRFNSRLAFFLFGILLFIILIYRINPQVVLDNFSKIGLWFFVTCFIAFCWIFLQSLAWAIVQSAFQPVPFLTLFRAKVMADGLNTLLPTANMGGEAARALIIKKHSPLQEGIPGIVFDKTIEYVASLVYLAAGLFISLLYLKVPESLKIPSLVVLFTTGVGTIILVFLQFKGVYKILEKLAALFPKAKKWLLEKEKLLRQFDVNMRLLFSHSWIKLMGALTLHIISRLLGAMEIFVIIKALGLPATLVKVIFISVFVVIMNTAFFLIPGQWGAAEGANLLAAVTVGYPASVGLSIGIVRRARKIFFAALTVLLLFLRKEKLKLKDIRPEEPEK
ncbi:MAG: flippase-like domain-containing protein [Candidatus Aminicenantes bacterium]|nr:flippase-like domain-containing protein [Candidatus Aminicenantes bacterium]